MKTSKVAPAPISCYFNPPSYPFAIVSTLELLSEKPILTPPPSYLRLDKEQLYQPPIISTLYRIHVRTCIRKTYIKPPSYPPFIVSTRYHIHVRTCTRKTYFRPLPPCPRYSFHRENLSPPRIVSTRYFVRVRICIRETYFHPSSYQLTVDIQYPLLIVSTLEVIISDTGCNQFTVILLVCHLYTIAK